MKLLTVSLLRKNQLTVLSYRVQVGAFYNLQNAIDLEPGAEADGL